LHEIRRLTNYQLEERKVVVGSGGETLVVQFKETEEGGAKGTRVIAETKKGLVGRVGQKSWTNAVLDQAERILKEAKP